MIMQEAESSGKICQMFINSPWWNGKFCDIYDYESF